MEGKYNLTLVTQTVVLLFSPDLFNVHFRILSAATIQNLPLRFLCGWQKKFLAENWVLKTTKTKATSPKQSGKGFF